MEYLSSDKVAVIDLASGEVSEDELSEELVAGRIGGAGITAALYNEHLDGDPIVLGAGLLTGTLTPASSLAVITAKSPLTGGMVHAPLTQYMGQELKYSGVDYLVIKGVAAQPSFLWIHDGIVDLEAAGNLWGMDVWSAVRTVRQQMGDELIQVLGAGPAAEKGSSLAQVMINQWASGDRFGLGKVLAAKNLKMIAVRGMGLLEIAEEEDFVAKSLEMLAQVKTNAWTGRQGQGDLGAALGFDDYTAWLQPLVHRSHASFNTPFSYNTYLFLDDDPASLRESAQEEPGVLMGDPAAAGALRAMGLQVADAGAVIRACAKAGLDAVAVAKVCQAGGKTSAADILAALDSIDGAVEGLSGPFSEWAPPGLYPDLEIWKRRMAVAYVFGIDPIFALLSPEISEQGLVELAALGTGLEISQDNLNAVVAELCG
jgi:aldehyde:ferredoxin oxidoreductase